jgi:hypothetical protein
VTQSAPQVFPGIAPEQYAKLIEKAKAAGIDLAGNSGTALKYGVEVAWNYSPESRELSIHCLKTPFFVSTDDVNAKIRSLVESATA